ncbi:MAG: ATP synthase F1 subunit delta [Saprospirales bacterium]|nr:MAG: ATP synthase F1 subunit delta [Saprospirales bacterium]
MSNFSIISRYAKSLIEIAEERNSTDAVVQDVNNILEALKNRDLFLLVKSPVVKPSVKQKVIDQIFIGKISEITAKFIAILIRKGREKMLPEILNGVLDHYRNVRGITKVRLITAVPAGQKLIDKLVVALTKSPSIKQVELTTKVNPDLIGGMIVDFGDHLIDASVKHELNVIKKRFYSAQIKGAIT